MKEKISNIIIILTFIMSISLPQILFWISGKKYDEFSVKEKRRLYDKPEFTLASIKSYPTEFDNYYNDHLPFKEELRNYYAIINYKLFNFVSSNSVLLGKDGWLFFRDDMSIEQTQGTFEYSDLEKNQILLRLENSIKYFAEKGIDTYVFVAPNKENIYREYLPDTVPIKSDITAGEKAISYIENNSGINVIYPKEEMLKAKEKYQIYRKYDTHWNSLGALIGVIALQKKVNPSFSAGSYLVEKNDNVYLSDLSIMANLENVLFENDIKITNFYDEINVNENINEKYVEYTSNAINDKTILIIGDSFGEEMGKHLAKLYKKVVYINRNNYEEGFTDTIKPDIIILEAVERFLPYFKMQLK